jgi:hypothetical protein
VAKLAPPSPKDHPNAYAVVSSASVSGILLYEANERLSIGLAPIEAAFIVGLIATAWTALGNRKSG